jgi:polyisoprenoid-binding protein YceI
MRMMKLMLAVGLVLNLAGGSVFAEVKTFKTVPGDVKNVVEFTSDAPMEKIVGKTPDITGTLELNPDDLMSAAAGSFTVDLRTLDTGINMRNQHMRENHLETDKFPDAAFTLTRFISSDKTSLVPGETAKVVAEGEFKIHGIGKSYQIPAKIYYAKSDKSTEGRLGGSKGDLLSVNAEFTVKLADHQIKRPELLFMKLAEEQKIEVSFAMTNMVP